MTVTSVLLPDADKRVQRVFLGFLSLSVEANNLNFLLCRGNFPDPVCDFSLPLLSVNILCGHSLTPE